jgi:protein-S-isoprenylcysteine O-methyltransferase Ste14
MDQATLLSAMLQSAWITARIAVGFGLLTWVAGVLFARGAPRVPAGPAAFARQGAGPRALAQLVSLLVGGALCALTRGEAFGLPPLLQGALAGLAALLGPLGGMLGAWTARTLGSALVFPAEVRGGLVTHGPFGIVRHPFYLSLALWATALGLALGSLSGTAVLLLGYLAASAWRARLEDAVLAEAFPQEFPAYAARVRGFLPKI